MDPDPIGPLTRFDAAVIVLKVLGLYELIHALPAMLFFPLWFFGAPVGRYDYTSGWIIIAAEYGPHLLMAFVLLYFSIPLSSRLMPSVAGGGQGRVLLGSGLRLQSIAFSVAGIVLALWSIPHLARGVAFYFYENRGKMGGSIDLADALSPEFIHFFVQAALGIWLFLGSKGLARYWHRIRRNGDPEPSAEP